MKFLILGNGSSGRAAAALAAKLGHETVTLDGADEFPAHFGEMRPPGGAPSGALSGAPFDGAIVSPGVPLDHPWQVACRAAGIPVKSELQFGCEELRRRGWRLLAVTGSKGKSSVVKLVADALNLAGQRAVACGNYGLPVCKVACSESAGWAVVEVSSFMMETTDLPADTFEAAAILNLQEDHLDRHGSVEVYHALKQKLLGFAKKGWSLESCCRGLAVPSAARETTSPQQQALGDLLAGSYIDLLAGSYFDNEILRPNGAAAIFLLRAAGLDDAAIARAFASFEPLPHRMNTVGVFRGVRCIDDSKATSLAALAAGVRMASANRQSPTSLSPLPSTHYPLPSTHYPLPSTHYPLPSTNYPRPTSIRLIAGGLPKGDDPKSVLGDLTARVKKVYLIGQSAEQFASAWSEAVDCEICGTMERAVRLAMREAESGETLLLSPGTASFDQFKSFGERGDVFADLVKKEGTDK